MKLFRRSNGTWYIRYRDETGHRRMISTGQRDRKRAEEEAQRIMRGEHPTRKVRRMTLERALWDTYDRIWSRNKSARETRYLVGALARSRIGGRDIEEITYPVLVDYVDSIIEKIDPDTGEVIQKGLKPASVNRRLAAISKALNESAKLGYISAAPAMPHQKENNERTRWLTFEEEQELLDTCGEVLTEVEAPKMRALLVFLADTGARLSEALRVAGRSPSRNQVTFMNTKNGKHRTVPLTPRAAEAMPLMPTDWNKDKCIRRFNRVRDKAAERNPALADVTLHVYRHTCASRLVMGGMDLYRVQKWMGHSTIQVTERYAHLAPSALADGAAILAQPGANGPRGATSGAQQQPAPHLRVVK